MVKIVMLTAVLAGLSLSCSKSDDILATYRGGLITRADLHSRLASRDLSVDMFRRKKMFQAKELKMMGIDRIAILEAIKNKFHESERFLFLSEDIRSRLLGTFLLDHVIKKNGFSEPAVKVRHIVFKVIGDPEKTIMAVKHVIGLLEKGESFEKLAGDYSSDVTRTKGGLLGYIIKGMLPDEYTKAAFGLEKGEFSDRPVILNNGKRIFLIKVENRVNLTADNFNRIIANPKMRQSYRKAILRKNKEQFIKSQKNRQGVTISDISYSGSNASRILFSIDKKNYTVGDINKRAENIQKISHKSTLYNKDLFWRGVAEKYLVAELLKSEALKRKIDKDPDYQKKLHLMMQSFLPGEYMEFHSRQNVSIKEKEIYEEYMRNRDKSYTTYHTAGNKRIKKVLSYQEAHDKIFINLQNMRAIKIKTNWLINLLEDYNFKIIQDRLEGE